MATCGHCAYCDQGTEQFCTTGQMIGKHGDGGYAEFIVVPARSVFPLPDDIPFEQGAVMMCSSATAFHGLRKGRLEAGERVAIFGAGGLGMSAIQSPGPGRLAVFAVDRTRAGWPWPSGWARYAMPEQSMPSPPKFDVSTAAAAWTWRWTS